jgi:hypothetical protein
MFEKLMFVFVKVKANVEQKKMYQSDDDDNKRRFSRPAVNSDRKMGIISCNNLPSNLAVTLRKSTKIASLQRWKKQKLNSL